MEADIIIKNGKCMTMKNRETADWLAIKDGRIAAIGGGNQYEPMAECSCTVRKQATENKR